MSVDLYQTGVSGLLTAQQQLATTGNNISNVNTEGYNRQRVEQNASIGQRQGSNYVGTGVFVKDISRVFNKFTFKEQLTAQTQKGSADSLEASTSQLNDIMNASGVAIADATQSFYQAVHGITDNPSDVGLRSIMLTQANVLAKNFNTLNDSFDKLEASTNGEISEIANRISEISKELALLNDQVLQNKKLDPVGEPNQILDRRDQLLFELSEYTNVTTVEDANGIMNVMIGQGITLVAGITAMTVGVKAGDPDPNKLTLTLNNTANSIGLDATRLGGAMAAKFDFRDNKLAQARRDIDRLALGIAETINQAQADGLDLNQLQGANIFNDINSVSLQQSRVLNKSTNAGNLQAQVTITDITKLPAEEFTIRFDGTNYIMTRVSDNSTTNLGAPGAGTYTTAFGFDFIESSGAPSTNDSFTVRPHENAASLMEVVMTDGSAIAASSAVEITPSDNNVSAGKVVIKDMFNPVAARAAMPMRIDVLENPPGSFTYTVTDSGGTTSAPIAYTPPSQVVNLPLAPATALFQVEIQGTPSGVAPLAPEQFNIRDAYGPGNSTNAFNMAATKDKPILNNGKESFAENISITNSKVGSDAKTASIVAETAQTLYTQAFNRNQQISGVNLDEEAANMLKFQQAYRAASQIITTANTLFDTLLSATR